MTLKKKKKEGRKMKRGSLKKNASTNRKKKVKSTGLQKNMKGDEIGMKKLKT